MRMILVILFLGFIGWQLITSAPQPSQAMAALEASSELEKSGVYDVHAGSKDFGKLALLGGHRRGFYLHLHRKSFLFDGGVVLSLYSTSRAGLFPMENDAKNP